MMQTLLLVISVSTIPAIQYQRNKVKTTLKLKQTGKSVSTLQHTNKRKCKKCLYHYHLEGKLELDTDVICSKHSGHNDKFPEGATKKGHIPLSPEKPKMEKKKGEER